MFHGSIVALVTPMFDDGTVDFNSLSELIEWHIDNCTDGILILGTTGESATINRAERMDLLKRVVDQVAERVPVIAGSGTNWTEETIELTRLTMNTGVDACLLVTPYYNKPTQEGLFLHYQSVANAVPIPLILYNVPSRTGCDLLPETVGRLARIPNIVGLKEATGDINRAHDMIHQCENRMDLYSGDDATSLEFILAGGRGVMSVTANVAPREMHEMCCAALENNISDATLLQEKLIGLHKTLFVESNPIPVKWALQEMGKIAGGIRLPLTTLSGTHHSLLREAMHQAGIVTTH